MIRQREWIGNGVRGRLVTALQDQPSLRGDIGVFRLPPGRGVGVGVGVGDFQRLEGLDLRDDRGHFLVAGLEGGGRAGGAARLLNVLGHAVGDGLQVLHDLVLDLAVFDQIAARLLVIGGRLLLDLGIARVII